MKRVNLPKAIQIDDKIHFLNSELFLLNSCLEDVCNKSDIDDISFSIKGYDLNNKFRTIFSDKEIIKILNDKIKTIEDSISNLDKEFESIE